jgi:CRISPR-associated protein Cas5t
MIGLRLTVPMACWRKAHARELLETEVLPPPATCYGALLSLVGETERKRHIGCRVTSGLLNAPAVSTVLRTLWRIKDKKTPQGNGNNARPDFQQLVLEAELMIWCDSRDETSSGERLEERVTRAMRSPETVERFGGWSLGESTHLINDASLAAGGAPPRRCRAFLQDAGGAVTLPVWVDHVGTDGTQYAVGDLREIDSAPSFGQLPMIMPPEDRAEATPRHRKEV